MSSSTSVEIDKLMKRMYRLWNIRSRSEKEIRDYFRIKGKEKISALAIKLVIKKLKQKGLLNDEEFAKAWVEARSKKKGPRVLKQELLQKGIAREIIDEVISDKVEGISQEETASQLLKKKMRVWKNLPTLEFKKKAYEFLTRRGFEYEIVKEIVEKLSKIN